MNARHSLARLAVIALLPGPGLAYEEYREIVLLWAATGEERVWRAGDGINVLPQIDNDLILYDTGINNETNYYNADFADAAFFVANPCPEDFRTQYGCKVVNPPGSFPVGDAGPGAKARGPVLITDTTMTGVLAVVPTNDEGAGPQPGTIGATGYNLRSSDNSPFGNAWYGISDQATLTLELTGTFTATRWEITGGTMRFNDPEFQCAVADFSGVLCSAASVVGDGEGSVLSWGLDSTASSEMIAEIPVYDRFGAELLETLSGVRLSASVMADQITTISGEVRRAIPAAACADQLRWNGAITCGTLVLATLDLTGPATVPGPGGLEARDDLAQTQPGEPVEIDVLVNDALFGPLPTVRLFSNPSNGKAIVTGSPDPAREVRIRYTPNPGFTGSDRFGYALQLDSGEVSVAEVRVGVREALDDVAQTSRARAVEIPVAINDIGFTDPVTLEISEEASHGVALPEGSPGPAATATIVYTPDADFSGADSFEYRIRSGHVIDSARVFLSVAGAAQDDTIAVDPGVASELAVLANDLGFSAPVTLSIVESPSVGLASVVGSPGRPDDVFISFTPPPGFIGETTLRYRAEDAFGASDALVTVVVRIDEDKDGVDDAIDNCLGIGNPAQRDTDNDGYGNRCDADLDNSGFVAFPDLAQFKSRFATSDADADLDGNGFVNFSDLATLRSLFGAPPGPSALAP